VIYTSTTHSLSLFVVRMYNVLFNFCVMYSCLDSSVVVCIVSIFMSKANSWFGRGGNHVMFSFPYHLAVVLFGRDICL
jgi:hypothetical protein